MDLETIIALATIAFMAIQPICTIYIQWMKDPSTPSSSNKKIRLFQAMMGMANKMDKQLKKTKN